MSTLAMLTLICAVPEIIGWGVDGNEEVKREVLRLLRQVETLQGAFQWETEDPQGSMAYQFEKIRQGDFWCKGVKTDNRGTQRNEFQTGSWVEENYIGGLSLKSLQFKNNNNQPKGVLHRDTPVYWLHLEPLLAFLGDERCPISFRFILSLAGWGKVFDLSDGTTVYSFRNDWKQNERVIPEKLRGTASGWREGVDVYFVGNRNTRIDLTHRAEGNLCPRESDVLETEPDLAYANTVFTYVFSNHLDMNGAVFPCYIERIRYRTERTPAERYGDLQKKHAAKELDDCTYGQLADAPDLCKKIPEGWVRLIFSSDTIRMNEPLTDADLDVNFPKTVAILDRATNTITYPSEPFMARYSDYLVVGTGLTVVTLMAAGVWAWRRRFA